MSRTTRSLHRPSPVFRECDGAPWPTDDELDLDAEWAALHDGGSTEWWGDDEPQPSTDATSTRCVRPADVTGAVSALDARLGHLEEVAAERQRATAAEYRLIRGILDDAAADPTPWVGPDPTVDRAWHDPRGRTARAVQRDRVDVAERAAVAEIAVRLHLSEQTVRTRAGHARTLADGCPRIWAAFGEGRLSEKHAIEAARTASTLPAGDRDAFSRFDEEALAPALTLTPARFAVAVRVIRERVHTESLETRHRRAAQDRGVWMSAELDGMASIHALLPADRARAVMSRLDRAARHVHAAEDEERTLAQLRADAFADLVTMTEPPRGLVENADAASAHAGGNPDAACARTHAVGIGHAHAAGAHAHADGEADGGSAHAGGDTAAASARVHADGDAAATSARVHADAASSHAVGPGPAAPVAAVPGAPRSFRNAPPATIVVTVPALTLLGRGDEPATLEGYGPIDLDTARRLAGTATSWVRLLTHPVSGAPLVLDRTTYRVPVALRRWLGVTSPTCVFPGCGRAARDCDIDHRTAWADGGTTDGDNLDPKCRHHHRLRHESRWDITRSPGGEPAWTSPLGGTYGSDPPPF